VFTVVIDPYLGHASGQRPIEGKVLLHQVLEPLFSWRDRGSPGHSVVIVDATGLALSVERERRHPGWTLFFRRLNERRNGLMRRFPGTLVLAMPDVAPFATLAPDTWSVRSGVVRLDAEASRCLPAAERRPAVALAQAHLLEAEGDLDGAEVAAREGLFQISREPEARAEHVLLLVWQLEALLRKRGAVKAAEELATGAGTRTRAPPTEPVFPPALEPAPVVERASRRGLADLLLDLGGHSGKRSVY
jgi:hypothetical protein